MLTHPREELGSIALRLAHLYGGDHYPLDAQSRSRARRVAAWTADVFFFAVLCFAAFGLPATFRGPRGWLVPSLTVLCVTVLHGVLIFGAPRYHAPLAPSLALLAALGGRRVVGWFGNHRRAAG